MLLRERVYGFRNRVYKTRHGIWTQDGIVPIHMNILAVIENLEGKSLYPGHNIVTNDGDLHYAERMANESVTNVFTTHELASAGTPGKTANRSNVTVIGSTQKVQASGYPKTNDGDADNTGAGTDIVSNLGSYAKADFNAASITHGIITNPTPAASEVCLTVYAFAAGFGKTADDTLKVFVNHEALGV